MKIEMNLNDQVKVKLTEHGKEILEKYYDKPVSNYDKNGYRTFSIWEFANIFGKEFYNGQMKPSIVNNNLVIEIKTSILPPFIEAKTLV